MVMTEVQWYACVHESESRITYGRAPLGELELVVAAIKRDLGFHKLLGLQSKVFLRSSRLGPGEVPGFCERRANKNRGHYEDFETVKVDLRWD
jgi:hypothetical protein